MLGSGGREHALWWKLRMGDIYTRRVLCAPGNGGIPAEWCREIDLNDHDAVFRLCRDEKVDLVIVGPEQPLVDGIVDFLSERDVRVFGPSSKAAQLEASKEFTRYLCEEMGVNIRQPEYRVTHDLETALLIAKNLGAPIVIKGDGPRDGKGAHVCSTVQEAFEAISLEMADPANRGTILIEECLVGNELSLMSICDGRYHFDFTAGDKKRRFEGDEGSNTGSMGSYSPSCVIDEATQLGNYGDSFITPVLREMEKRGIPFHGILYAGLMNTREGSRLLEYNVRYGDSECQALLPRIEDDLFPYLMAATELGGLAQLPRPRVSDMVTVCVNLVSDGYPGSYEKGFRIFGISAAEKTGALVFHAGTRMVDNNLYSSGGRVLNVVGRGKTYQEARMQAYNAVEKIHFQNMAFRTDIGLDL